MSQESFDKKMSRMERIEAKQARLWEELEELENKAGVHQDTERAREGPLIPLSFREGLRPYGSAERDRQIEDEDDDDYDTVRRRIRRIYFSVADSNLRSRLIRNALQIRHVESDRRALASAEAEAALASAKISAGRLPWLKAGVVAAVYVGIGYTIAEKWIGASGIAGAIAGGVAGFFFGKGVIANAEREARERIESAEAVVRMHNAARDLLNDRPSLFNPKEADTGEEDEQFDLLSARAARAKARRQTTGE